MLPPILLLGLPRAAGAQGVIVLDSCGVSYIDPQDANDQTSPTRDTLVYTAFFSETDQLRAFFVDINAFGGQQTDRAQVFAILPGGSLRPLGGLAFGSCADCVEGFALVHDGVLQVQGVSDRNTMNMWIQSFNQPAFALPGNLQTLRGAGRISGRLPLCAVGWRVEYLVSGNPASTTTEFSTHILCPQTLAMCAIEKEARPDCGRDSLYLRATLPAACFFEQSRVRWRSPRGQVVDGREAALPLQGSEGWYYLEVDLDGCTLTDSLLVELPAFVEAGADRAVCRGDAVALAGAGGQDPFWTRPDGSTSPGAGLNIADAAAADAGRYVYHAVNDLGCEDTDTLTLDVRIPPEPRVEVSAACLGDTVFLSVGNAAAFAGLRWFDPAGAPLDRPFIPGFQPADIGRYSVVGVDTAGCEAGASFDVSGSPPPEVEYVLEESCDTTRVFPVPGSYSFRWETGAEGIPFATATGGRFRVTVTDAAGCATIDIVEVPDPEGPNVGLELIHPECPADAGAIEIVADPGRPLIFSIDGGATYSLSPRFEGLAPGGYTVVVQDDLGCLREFRADIVAPDTMGVSLNTDSLRLRPGAPVTLNATTAGRIRRYQWLPETIDSGAPVTSFTAFTNMDIRIIVEDERGCKASDALTLTIVLGDIYVPNAFSPNGDGRNDRFTFYSDNGSGETIELLQIFDRWGNLLFEGRDLGLNDETRGWDGAFRGRPLGPGVLAYYGIVRFGNGARQVYKGDVTLLR